MTGVTVELEPGMMFEIDPVELPGVVGHLIAQSETYGSWLVACTFGDEVEPGVIVPVSATEVWFELGRWTVCDQREPLDIPLPHTMVMSRGRDVVEDFHSNYVRDARPGDGALLGPTYMVSQAALVKACKAHAGLIESDDRLYNMSAEMYLLRAALYEP